MFFFFFFQAEDGIRDGHVTGVQTCALPISRPSSRFFSSSSLPVFPVASSRAMSTIRSSRLGRNSCRDRKSTRLNSSHVAISYAVFCLKKKKKTIKNSNQDKKIKV